MRALMPLSGLLLATVAVLPSYAKDKVTPATEMVSCEGVFGPGSSEALLTETFGKDNVVTGMIDRVEGEQSLATTVFPDDLDRRMIFGWWDEENHSYLSYVDLGPDKVTPLGLRIGMSVADVEAINGAPFNIGGFWWDYGGGAAFETGKLVHPDQGCGFYIGFDITDDIPADLDVNAIAGEVLVPSSEPLLKTLHAHVASITIVYPYPDALPQTDSD